MIQIRNVNFSYSSDNDVLKDISLDIRDGEFLAIVGHNGSGKSTLAKTINGLILPQAERFLSMGYIPPTRSPYWI